MTLLYNPRDTMVVLHDAETEYYLSPRSTTPVPDHLRFIVGPDSIFAKMGVAILTGEAEIDRGKIAQADARWQTIQQSPGPTMSPEEIRDLDLNNFPEDGELM